MILLDAHIVTWLAFDPDKLSKCAKEAKRAARIQGGLAIAGITPPGVGLACGKGACRNRA